MRQSTCFCQPRGFLFQKLFEMGRLGSKFARADAARSDVRTASTTAQAARWAATRTGVGPDRKNGEMPASNDVSTICSIWRVASAS